MGTSYELKGDLYSNPNPIRDYSSGSTGVGIRGIMAVHNSYDATSLDPEYARRDGTSTMTGDWEFTNYNVTQINTLEAKTVRARNIDVQDKIKLPAIKPTTGCDMATQSLGIDAASGEIFICRVKGGGFGDSTGTGWWKAIVSTNP